MSTLTILLINNIVSSIRKRYNSRTHQWKVSHTHIRDTNAGTIRATLFMFLSWMQERRRVAVGLLNNNHISCTTPQSFVCLCLRLNNNLNHVQSLLCFYFLSNDIIIHTFTELTESKSVFVVNEKKTYSYWARLLMCWYNSSNDFSSGQVSHQTDIVWSLP